MRETTLNYTLTPPVLAPRSHARREVIETFAGVDMRRRIYALQDAMIAKPSAQIAIEPRHVFADGLYCREVVLPAGSVSIGHTHRQEHVCIISKGRVQVVSEDEVREIAAPATLVIPAGRKNCVHAIEDTVWTTIHACRAETAEEAEALLVYSDEEARLCLS